MPKQLSRSEKAQRPDLYIFNPETNRYVLRTTSTGRRLIKKYESDSESSEESDSESSDSSCSDCSSESDTSESDSSESDSSESDSSDSDSESDYVPKQLSRSKKAQRPDLYILNPDTNRYVLKTASIGKRLIKKYE